jgi:MYXO-CTERM domain-containing protein
VHGNSDGCDAEGWDSTFRKVGYVRACGVPDANFVVEHEDGLQYRMLNDTDVSVFGCIQDIVWQVYKGKTATGEPIASLTAKAWEPVINFPETGDYTVVLNIGGPAGTGAAKVSFFAEKRRGQGRSCSTMGSTGTGAAALILLGLLGLRRRE